MTKTFENGYIYQTKKNNNFKLYWLRNCKKQTNKQTKKKQYFSFSAVHF